MRIERIAKQMTGKELEQIYNAAYKAVYWTAMSLLKNEADAEDVVQDTFVSFIESYSDLTDTTKATALLKKIAANKCLNRIKLARTDNADEEFFENVEAVPEDFLPDSIIESEDMRKVVMDIINKSLSEDIRRTLILFYFDEMSTKEIAESLGIPQGTVLWRLNFAKKKIKKEVGKYEEENNTKLFGMAIPFLSKLFIKEAEQVAFKPMPVKLANLSASAQASAKGAVSNASIEAAKKGTGIVMKKLILGVIASVVAVAVMIAVIVVVVKKNNESASGRSEDEYSYDEDDAAGAGPASNGSDGSKSGSDSKTDRSPFYITVNGADIYLGDNIEDVRDVLGDEVYPRDVSDSYTLYSFESVHICAYPDGRIFNMACQVGHGDWKLSGSLDGESTKEDIIEFYGMDPYVNEDSKLLFNCYVGDCLEDASIYLGNGQLFEVGLTSMS